MKRQKLTEAEARRLGDAIAAEARALGFVGKEKKCRRKQSAVSFRTVGLQTPITSPRENKRPCNDVSSTCVSIWPQT